MFRPLIAFSLAAGLAIALAGCAHDPHAYGPVGRLTLNAELAIPANAATVRLQYGRVTAFNAVQEQDAFCVFEIDTVKETPQPVSPGQFEVSDIRYSIETFAGMPAMGFTTHRVGFGRDDRPSQIYYKTAFILQPNPQQARNLTCMSNQMYPGIAIMRHLTLAEIRQALGNHFTLDLGERR